MARYVQYGSLMTPPAPFNSLSTTLTGFWVKGNHEKLKHLCRTVFTQPSGGEVDFRPLGPWVMITWGDIGRVVSETPPYDRRGGVREPQVSVWVPVVRVRERFGFLPVAESFGMFVPYIWLDNAMSLATGRELFGYPKAWGWPRFPGDGDDPRRWRLDVFGLDYEPDALAGRKRNLLEVVEGESLGSSDELLDTLGDVARHAASRLLDPWGGIVALPGLELADSVGDDLRAHGFAGVFLKQFRTVEDGLEACLQQVVECRYEVTRVEARPLTSAFELKVRELDSHPVVDELGVDAQEIELAYAVDMDFRVGSGRVLWDSSDS